MSTLSESALYQELMNEIPQLQQQRDQSLIASLEPGKVSGTQASMAAIMSMLPMVIGAALADRKSQGIALGAASGGSMMENMMKKMKEAGAEEKLLAATKYKTSSEDLKDSKQALRDLRTKGIDYDFRKGMQEDRQIETRKEGRRARGAAAGAARILAEAKIVAERDRRAYEEKVSNLEWSREKKKLAYLEGQKEGRLGTEQEHDKVMADIDRGYTLERDEVQNDYKLVLQTNKQRFDEAEGGREREGRSDLESQRQFGRSILQEDAQSFKTGERKASQIFEAEENRLAEEARFGRQALGQEFQRKERLGSQDFTTGRDAIKFGEQEQLQTNLFGQQDVRDERGRVAGLEKAAFQAGAAGERQEDRQDFQEMMGAARDTAAQERAETMAGGRVDAANIKAKGAVSKRKVEQARYLETQYTNNKAVQAGSEKLAHVLYIKGLLQPALDAAAEGHPNPIEKITSTDVGAVRTNAPRAFGESGRMTEPDVDRTLPLPLKGEVRKLHNWLTGGTKAPLSTQQVIALGVSLDKVIAMAGSNMNAAKQDLFANARHVAPNMAEKDVRDLLSNLDKTLMTNALAKNRQPEQGGGAEEAQVHAQAMPTRQDHPSDEAYQAAMEQWKAKARTILGQ